MYDAVIGRNRNANDYALTWTRIRTAAGAHGRENSRSCNTYISQSFEHKGGSADVQVVADVAAHWTGFAMTSLQGGIHGTGRAADRRLDNKRPKNREPVSGWQFG
jgi:hypothetical protein